MDGSEKLKPLFIGKYSKPRCFKNFKSLPVTYRNNKKSWMTTELWNEWLETLNNDMRKQGRKIILFVDNCTIHNNPPTLSNVRIEFLPTNTTSKLQPLDQGIIKNFKVLYRKEIVSEFLACLDNNDFLKVTILTATTTSHKAWNNVTGQTIRNCIRTCGFVKAIDREEDKALATLEVDSQWHRLSTVPVEQLSTFAEFVAIDDDLAICGVLNDEDILNKADDEEGNDEEECCEDPPTIWFKITINKTNLWCLTLFISLVSDDPALWTTNEDTINHVIEHGFKQNLQNSQFPESKRIIPGTSSRFRYLSLSLFQRTLLNGELGNREYLSYSVTTGSVYCVPCRLFGNQVPIAQEGWSDWKHPERVTDHENTNDHKNCVLTMIERNRKKGKIDSELIASLEFEKKYWRNVLTRVVAIVVSLTSRGLPMRGHNECFGSLHNGNFMRELELIAQFDHFLSKHIAQYRNSGRGKVSYLSSTTYYEVIHIMKNKIMKTIINEVKNAKYFSIVVDSTPDISHTDQLSLIYRYVLNGIPVERFIQFIPNTGHKSKEIADAVLKAIHEHGLDIKNCRGQSYDNASNMSGKYSGLQARMKEVSPLAEYAPCSAHSVNLVGQCAADSSQESTAFFCLMQNIYVFFSSSTSRWTTFISHTSTNITLKRKSDTRWSARYDMCCNMSRI
ncbi:hypothetical protein QTP88_027605 [Uroleucon formosanum]